jgi:hypothetical protein
MQARRSPRRAALNGYCLDFERKAARAMRARDACLSFN